VVSFGLLRSPAVSIGLVRFSVVPSKCRYVLCDIQKSLKIFWGHFLLQFHKFSEYENWVYYFTDKQPQEIKQPGERSCRDSALGQHIIDT